MRVARVCEAMGATSAIDGREQGESVMPEQDKAKSATLVAGTEAEEAGQRSDADARATKDGDRREPGRKDDSAPLVAGEHTPPKKGD